MSLFRSKSKTRTTPKAHVATSKAHTTVPKTPRSSASRSKVDLAARVEVYSTSWCPYCHVLMSWLDDLQIPYQEIDAENLNLQSVPVTKIISSTETVEIVGFDRPNLKKSLKSVGLLK